MCSIMGYCGPVVDLDKFKEGFQRTISRGPDDSRIVDTGNGLLGFHRLAIMGLTPSGMQPFQLDGSYVVCNGEIYGFEKIKEELSDRYSFASDSDCEILLPLYKEYGTDMFAMLDADSHVFSMTAIQVNILRQEIPLESVLSITDMMKKV